MPTSARSRASSLPSWGSGLAVDRDGARVDRLQAVDGAAQRGLAGPGGSDDDDDLAAGDGQVDVLEHMQRAEVLVDVLQHDQVVRHRRSPASLVTDTSLIGCSLRPPRLRRTVVTVVTSVITSERNLSITIRYNGHMRAVTIRAYGLVTEADRIRNRLRRYAIA